MGDIITGELLLNRKKQSIALTTIVIFVLLAILVFFYFFSFIPIDGDSMENTIFNEQYCFIQRKSFDVNRGDIVIIDVSNDGNKAHDIVKRVIATSGDKLIFMHGKKNGVVELYICKKGENKFVKLNEPYIKENMLYSSNNYYDYKDMIMPYTENLTEYDLDTVSTQISAQIDPYVIYVPENRIFFLGDNRNISRDSRYYGTRPLEKVKYKVLSIMY